MLATARRREDEGTWVPSPLGRAGGEAGVGARAATLGVGVQADQLEVLGRLPWGLDEPSVSTQKDTADAAPASRWPHRPAGRPGARAGQEVLATGWRGWEAGRRRRLWGVSCLGLELPDSSRCPSPPRPLPRALLLGLPVPPGDLDVDTETVKVEWASEHQGQDRPQSVTTGVHTKIKGREL